MVAWKVVRKVDEMAAEMAEKLVAWMVDKKVVEMAA